MKIACVGVLSIIKRDKCCNSNKLKLHVSADILFSGPKFRIKMQASKT